MLPHSDIMDTVAQFHKTMPGMRRHEGGWTGTYTHLDANNQLLDIHDVRVRCEFPSSGPYVYIQYNHFIWEDGREYRAELPGVFKDGRLWWDTDTFHGSAWETLDGIILLNLARKDEPGATFLEMITMGEKGDSRARTWHWFKDGQLYKRTLCNERRISD